MARLHPQPERPEGACDQHFARCRLACLACDFHTPAVQPLHFIAKPQRRQLKAVRSERVGLDNLRARFDIRLMYTKNRFRLGGVQLIEASLRPDGFMQHRSHRSIGDKDGVFEPLIEIMNLHACLSCRWKLKR